MQEPRVNQLQRSLSCTLVEHLTPLRVCIVFFIYAIGLLALYATTWPKEGVSGVAGNIDDVEVARERWLVNILTNMTAYCFILFPLLLLRWLSEPLLNLWQSDKTCSHESMNAILSFWLQLITGHIFLYKAGLVAGPVISYTFASQKIEKLTATCQFQGFLIFHPPLMHHSLAARHT
uniref:Uncharacterized protein n=1 Tax=Schistocephalus solidus TaxID=70667 RepID=A0A0X3Q3B2_SCHSO